MCVKHAFSPDHPEWGTCKLFEVESLACFEASDTRLSFVHRLRSNVISTILNKATERNPGFTDKELKW